MYKIGFDNERYIKLQSQKILDRINENNKLYIEFGGKLFDDFHASRVLPGFLPDSKIKMLLNIKERVEIMPVISGEYLEKNKVRGDFGITYLQELMRLIDAFKEAGLYVGSCVITRYNKQPAANKLKEKLEKQGIKVAYHYPIADYPNDLKLILSKDGFGRNEYIENERDIVVITAPGPGSGKMATCLSQMYHDNLRGIKAGFAKFETFPIWNLALDHPLNIAYEAATADLNDVLMIDPFHLQAYGKIATNYNRDIAAFPVLNGLLKQINGYSIYQSPTDMGVNMIGFCIIDDEACRKASREEIRRRYYETKVAVRKEDLPEEAINKMQLILKKAEITEDRKVAIIANRKALETGEPAVAIELQDGQIITGKTSTLLGASSAALLNALKALGKLPDIKLLSKEIIEPIQKLKTGYLKGHNPRLHTDEVLIALAIESERNDLCRQAMEQLENLKNAEVHSTVMLAGADINTFKKLGMNLTMDPVYTTKRLYHKR